MNRVGQGDGVGVGLSLGNFSKFHIVNLKKIFNVYLLLRGEGKGQREREREIQNPKQATGSEPSAHGAQTHDL